MKKEFLAYFAIFLLVLSVLLLVRLLGGSVDAKSALSFLNVIAKISATLLGMFSAGFLFLLGTLSPRDIREIMSKSDFAASFLLFSVAILHSLMSMLTIDQDTTVNFLTLENVILYFLPFWWMIAGILVLAFFVWKLYVKRLET